MWIRSRVNWLDRDSANKKGLAMDIPKKMDKALKGQQHDSTTRCSIENTMSILSNNASV
jgi:hypothetical protein